MSMLSIFYKIDCKGEIVMPIKFEIFDLPNIPTTLEKEEQIAKRVIKTDKILKKKMKQISRNEAEAWKYFSQRR